MLTALALLLLLSYSDSLPVVPGLEFDTGSEHAMVREPCGTLHLVYVDSFDVHYRYSTDNGLTWSEASNVSESRTASDSAPGENLQHPSIAVTPGDIVHVAWQRTNGSRQGIMYREYRDGLWSDTVRISTIDPTLTEPASHPALEAYGDCIYCVWSGPNEQGGFPADIWQSKRWLWNEPWDWFEPENQSRTSHQKSDFPVMTTDFVTVWQEDVGDELRDGQDSGGQFRMKRIARIPSGPIAPSTSRIVCCDSDQDGRQEVIFRTGSIRPEDPLRVEIWEYRPVNRFELVYADTGAYPLPPGITTGNLRISDCGDLDADGLFDLTGLNVDNQGPGSAYTVTMMHESPSRHQYPESLVWRAGEQEKVRWPLMLYTGDLDGDGREEILVPSDIGRLIYENVGDNRNELVWVLPPGTVDGFELAIEDFDGDGFREFLTAGVSNGVVSLFKCVGDNQYELAYQDTVGLPNGHDVFSGRNFDEEGKPRFFVRFKVVPWDRWYLYMWEPVGKNRFERTLIDEKTLGAQGVSSRSVCGDISGDGFSEVVWAVPTGLYVYKATGHNQFEQVWSWRDDHGTHFSVDTRIRDMNNNGYNNLVVAGSFRTSVFEVEAVRLLYPHGGQEYQAGDTCRIRWRTFTPPRCDSVSLFLVTDTVVPDGEWFWRLDTIATGIAPGDSSYDWVIPDTVLDSAWVAVIAYGPGWQHDISNAPFRIVPVGVREAEALAWEQWQPQTVLRGVFPVPEGINALLFDVSGRRAMELTPGDNDVRHLSPGVYFIRAQGSRGQGSKGLSAKVIVQR